MKQLALIASFFVLSAQAADYDCQFAIERDGKTVGIMNVGQNLGTTAGRIYTLPVSVKKNVLGKSVETVEVTLDGTLFNGGESDGNTGIDATFTLVTAKDRDRLGSRTTSVTKVELATIKGLGRVLVNETHLNGYSVRGECHVNE